METTFIAESNFLILISASMLVHDPGILYERKIWFYVIMGFVIQNIIKNITELYKSINQVTVNLWKYL